MMFLRCLFQPVTMTSLQTAPSGKYVETLNFCQSFIYTLQQNMKGLRWLGLVWHSVLCFPRMARLQSDAPVSVSLVYFPKSLLSPFLQVRKCSLHSHGVPQWPVCHRPLRRSPPIWGRCHRHSQILRKVYFSKDSTMYQTNTFRNLLTVAVNNTLTRFTVPQGYTKWGVEAEGYPAGYSTLEYNFDFFNYAGIHRCLLDVKIQRAIYTIL